MTGSRAHTGRSTPRVAELEPVLSSGSFLT